MARVRGRVPWASQFGPWSLWPFSQCYFLILVQGPFWRSHGEGKREGAMGLTIWALEHIISLCQQLLCVFFQRVLLPDPCGVPDFRFSKAGR